ncbi:CHAT domain-containing protein [Saccharothrix lopnurensis]|uniref:CHAT domain-containing protein n=1 Tax=Saccharothrix lopnurensis TaxID=1670621 RepID=A0ABW1P5L5_9PSEU
MRERGVVGHTMAEHMRYEDLRAAVAGGVAVLVNADRRCGDSPARRPAGPAAVADHRATTEAVLTRLRRSTWCHFACHAVQDARSPSRSALALHDPLTTARISRLRMESAELAYLSACSTAYSGPQLPHESIHLSSAFHLAGFKHVIAGL